MGAIPFSLQHATHPVWHDGLAQQGDSMKYLGEPTGPIAFADEFLLLGLTP